MALTAPMPNVPLGLMMVIYDWAPHSPHEFAQQRLSLENFPEMKVAVVMGLSGVNPSAVTIPRTKWLESNKLRQDVSKKPHWPCLP
ncbi:hypothetical protein K443DRAFT_681446 [Laccaria amethystina LaAM-08-1]|uniref:Unplaced genomic scaffold K443scaffold_156, whole genome shotgun sequence n=1 Tax=Laccaria amethystina LaAM-08-1 TaxID=1095629 RepID=A0A0C9XND6_9AGAR|nr:hypothetical protein K443DRAFT_681446 [Laccaria amethystina LaAM-08-1]